MASFQPAPWGFLLSQNLDILRVAWWALILALNYLWLSPVSFMVSSGRPQIPGGPFGGFLLLSLTLSRPWQEKSVHIAGPPPLFSTVVHPVPLLMTVHFQGREDTTEEWSTAQSGKRILSVCDAPWQESGMAETEKLCASDFMRA